MSGSILPSYAANAYLYGAPMQAQPVAQGGPSFLTSLVANQPSPLTSRETAERSALQALLNISSGGQASDVESGPAGAPSTGSVMGDLAAAHNAGLTQAALGIATNPAGLAVSVPATMAAAAINAATGVPAKGLADVMGVRGLATQLSQVPAAIQNAMQGLPSKPEGFVGFGEMESKEAAPEKSFDTFDPNDLGGALGTPESSPGSEAGESKDSTTGTTDNDNSNSSAAGQDAAGNDGTGAGGAGTGAGAPGNDSDGWASGGLVTYARGGVIALEGGGKVAVGPGGGLDDLIPTNINGRRAAALSDGEFVIPADVVSMMGDGSSNAGARRLYDLVKQIREEKTGTSRQAGPLPVAQILKRTMS